MFPSEFVPLDSTKFWNIESLQNFPASQTCASFQSCPSLESQTIFESVEECLFTWRKEARMNDGDVVRVIGYG